MKRTYSPTRSRLSITLLGGWWSVGALLCALVLLAFRYALPGFFLRVTMPVSTAGATVAGAVHGVAVQFADAAALSKKVDALTQQNAALGAQNRALLQQVSSIASLASPATSTSIVAGVVARPPMSPYDTLVLAAGTAAGVSAGMEVFGPGNTPLGVVTSVTSAFSRATLFSAPGQTVLGWAGAQHVPVTLEGTGGGSFSAVLPRSAGVAAGDVVYVSGPGALPVGTVQSLSGDPSAPSVALDIVPALNLYTVTWVALRDTGVAFTNALGSATTSAP